MFSSYLHSLWLNSESDGQEKQQINTLFCVKMYEYIQDFVLEV